MSAAWRFAGFLFLTLAIWHLAAAATCGTKRFCGEMADCAEAMHYLEACGLERLDADNDGIPCERLCGKSRETLDRRRGGQSMRGLLPPVYTCGSKRTCAEMADCREARFNLRACGRKALDRDGDGIPCEGLCR